MAFDNGASSAMAYNNNVVASDPKFVKTTFNEIKESDDETRNLVSNTFGQLKKYVEGMFYCNGFSTNVSNAYYSAMNDPNEQINVGDKVYCQHPGVGNFRAYNEMGNPAGGCFSMHTYA